MGEYHKTVCAATKSFHGFPQVYCRKEAAGKLPKASEAFSKLPLKSFRFGGSFDVAADEKLRTRFWMREPLYGLL